MLHAIALARVGTGQVAPNPLVGAAIWNGDQLVGEGYHARFGERHAEVAAIEAAGERTRGATMYVNLEPCNHRGNTPPCTDAIIAAGLARVVIAVTDPNPVAAGGAAGLRSAGIDIVIGPGDTEASELNAAFLNSFVSDRPWVTLKLAVSLDSAIAPADRSRALLTGNLSNNLVHRMRSAHDAIAVGAATAAADDPLLTARVDPPPRIAPTRVVFDRSARLSAQSRLVTTAREMPTLIVTGETVTLPADLARAGVQSLPAHDLGDALRKLKLRGINSLMLEGGAGLAASFLGNGYVDRLVILQAPVILGNGSLNAFSGVAGQPMSDAPRFRLIDTARLEDDVYSKYAVQR